MTHWFLLSSYYSTPKTEHVDYEWSSRWTWRLTLSQPPSLSFRLQKCQHIALSHWTLHVPDDGAVAVIHELYSDLQE